MKFLIQTIGGNIRHDFSFTLIEAIHYYEWLYPGGEYEVVLSQEEGIGGFVPIGSVEFVSEYLFAHYGLGVTPRNIPEELLDISWTGREVINGTQDDIKGIKFVKSRDKIKGFTEICDSAPKGNYQISDVIDIQSEWRAFVYNNKLVGLQNYSGGFDIFPDVEKIRKMIEVFKTQPISYTLDVGISNGNTVIIEVHDFFSCGLYGFSDYNILPYMFSRWFYEYINK